MSTEFLAITYGISSALTWGAGDFSGGLASKRGNVLSVILYSQLLGVILLIAWGWLSSEPLPVQGFLIWGAVSGIFGSLGLVALYTALAQGKMGIVAPVSAIVTAMLPIFAALWSEGLPGKPQLLGFALALVAVWLLSFSGSAVAVEKSGLGLSLLAGIGFGMFFICIDQASHESVIWPLVAARFSSILFLLSIFAWRRGYQTPVKRQWPFVALAGVFDTAGNAFFALATQVGRLDVSAVLASLYPASTVLLAWLLLKEKLQPKQWFGVLAAVAALVLITL